MPLDSTPEEIKKRAAKVNQAGIDLYGGGVIYMNNPKQVENAFTYAQHAGMDLIVGVPEHELLELCNKKVKETGIKLAIHNHGKDISPAYWDPENLLEVCQDRSPLIGACGDLGYWSRSGIIPLDAIKMLGDRLITVQIHDLDNMGPDGHDVAWGNGEIELDAIIRHLNMSGVKLSLFGLEYSLDWDQERPEIRQSIDYFNDVCLKMAGTHQAGSYK